MCIYIYTCVNGALGALPAPGCTGTFSILAHIFKNSKIASKKIASNYEVEHNIEYQYLKNIQNHSVAYTNLMQTLGSTPIVPTLNLPVHGESLKDQCLWYFTPWFSPTGFRKVEVSIFLTWDLGVSANCECLAGANRRPQASPSERPKSGRSICNSAIQKSTKFVTKKHAKKNKKM